ncbi:MAG: uroporphyrinogen-III synthase [Methylobacteriaceae bacterium]|nr:uroporphyrinogen-III synthase [Methylobacteriaceae bacterium]
MLVLVTRPRDEAHRTARRLAEAGDEAIVAPVLEVRALATERPAGSFAAVLVTSAQAVPALPGAADAPVYAVGARTAAALAAHGLAARVADGDARALARLVAAELSPGSRLLHPCGRDRKPEPARSLARVGYSVVPWEVYAAEAAARLDAGAAEALRAGAVGAALHFSRRSAETLVALARREGLGEALADLGHACLSADVAAGLAGLAGARIAVAARPDEDALFAALTGFRPPAGGLAPATIGVLRTN